MIFRNNQILLFGFCFLIGNLLLGGELTDKAETIIMDNFGQNIKIEAYRLHLGKDLKNKSEFFAKQRFLGDFVYYYELKQNNEISGYAILDNVLGKVKPITYLLIFNSDLSIKSVEIIKYREQYGGSVGRREWLNQFNDKNLMSDIELNNTIEGITGATISVKSVIKGVKRLLYFINNMGENERDMLVSIE